MKTVTYTLSDASVEAQRQYSNKKSRAKTYVWKRLKTDYREVFDEIINDFNEENGGKITETGVI